EHGLRPLLDVLVDGGDGAEKRSAMALLGDLGNPGAATPLLKIALDPGREKELKPIMRRGIFDSGAPPRIDLRVEAAIAGARLAGPSDLPLLIKLADDPEKHLHAAALYALGRVKSAQGEPALVRALASPVGDLAALGCLGLGRQSAVGRAGEMARL